MRRTWAGPLFRRTEMHSSLAGSDAVPWLGATNSCPNAIGRQVVADDGTGWRGLSTSPALTSTQHWSFSAASPWQADCNRKGGSAIEVTLWCQERPSFVSWQSGSDRRAPQLCCGLLGTVFRASTSTRPRASHTGLLPASDARRFICALAEFPAE